MPADAPRPVALIAVQPRARLGAHGSAPRSSSQKCPRRFFYTARSWTRLRPQGNRLFPNTRLPVRRSSMASENRLWGRTQHRRRPRRLLSPFGRFAVLEDHAFAPDYRRLASRLVAALVNPGAGRRFRKSEPLALDFANWARRRRTKRDGRLARRGRSSCAGCVPAIAHSKNTTELARYALPSGGSGPFQARLQVEALHLTDETMEAVEIT